MKPGFGRKLVRQEHAGTMCRRCCQNAILVYEGWKFDEKCWNLKMWTSCTLKTDCSVILRQVSALFRFCPSFPQHEHGIAFLTMNLKGDNYMRLCGGLNSLWFVILYFDTFSKWQGVLWSGFFLGISLKRYSGLTAVVHYVFVGGALVLKLSSSLKTDWHNPQLTILVGENVAA